MQIAHSDDPQYRDKNAVFRATYYFRVFDVCALTPERAVDGPFINNHGQTKVLLNDSLYRFTMTGKADPLATKIKFESGILKAQEIDPFGAKVAFDSDNNQFYVKSQEQVQQDAARSETTARVDRLLQMREKLTGKKVGNLADDDPLVKQIDAAIQKQLVALGGDLPADTGTGGTTGDQPVAAQRAPTPLVGASGNTGTNSTSNAATGGTAVAKTSEPMTTDKCAQSNRIVRRGFQIMGPEAVKTFNQDDRLILAMLTSARPLISTIKDVASRLTSTRPASAADLKPLSDERVRVLQAERAVEQANAQSGADVTSVVDAAITALEGGNTQ